MDFIYTAIIDRFNNNQALFTDVNLQPIKHFDLFKGQYIYPELHLPYKRPAIFYAYLANWKSRSGKLDQEGTLQVRLHIELENYGQSFGHSQNRDYALQIFEYHKRINALVHGFSGTNFTPLKRVLSEPDEAPAQTNVEVLTYETKVVDETAQQFKDNGLIKEPLDEMTTTEKPQEIGQGKTSQYII